MTAFMRSHAIGEIAVRLEDRKTGLHGGPVEFRVVGFEQVAKDLGDFIGRGSVAAGQHPAGEADSRPGGDHQGDRQSNRHCDVLAAEHRLPVLDLADHDAVGGVGQFGDAGVVEAAIRGGQQQLDAPGHGVQLLGRHV